MADANSAKSASSRSMSRWCGGPKATTAHAALLSVQLGYGGYYVLSKAAMSDGVDKVVFAVYRDCIGLALLIPFAFVFERDLRTRVPFTLPVCFMILGLGLSGIYLQQMLFLAGLGYTNSAFTAAMQNAIPVFTFLIAVVCRVEVIRITKIDGIAKLLGIFFCIFGAVTMSLYKGIVLLGEDPSPLPTSDVNGYPVEDGSLASAFLKLGIDQWRLGSLCLVGNCFCMGVYHNLQVPALKRFPAPITLTACSVFVGTIALVTTGILTVSEPSQWALIRPTNLISVAYAGVVASGVNFTLQTWANHISGPVIVATYTPLQTFFSAVFGLVFLNEPLYLGTVIGATLMLIGLYVLIWGQRLHHSSEELQGILPFSVVPSIDIKEPLLPHCNGVTGVP